MVWFYVTWCYVIFLVLSLCVFYFFFFFQAEDGIRDRNVTGVQTCALPILQASRTRAPWLLPRTGFPARCIDVSAICKTARWLRQTPSRSGRREIRQPVGRDRKSTRLNSSHVSISYAVFCLKKKKTTPEE